MKFFRWLPVAAGVSLLLFLIRSMGATTLWNQIRSIGWIGLWIIFATYTVIFTLDTWGWHFSFPKAMTQTFRWHSLFGSRMAGEAVNYLTPLGALGGEPLKARILRSRYPISWSDSLVSLVVAKTSFVIGLILLILSGLSIAFWHSRLSNQLKWIALGLASAFALLILLFWLLQQWGLARRGYFQKFRQTFSSLFLKSSLHLRWTKIRSKNHAVLSEQQTPFFPLHLLPLSGVGIWHCGGLLDPATAPRSYYLASGVHPGSAVATGQGNFLFDPWFTRGTRRRRSVDLHRSWVKSSFWHRPCFNPALP